MPWLCCQPVCCESSSGTPLTLFMLLISSSRCRMRSAAPFTFSFSSLSSCQASSSSSLSLVSCSSLAFSSRPRIFSSACSWDGRGGNVLPDLSWTLVPCLSE